MGKKGKLCLTVDYGPKVEEGGGRGPGGGPDAPITALCSPGDSPVVGRTGAPPRNHRGCSELAFCASKDRCRESHT